MRRPAGSSCPDSTPRKWTSRPWSTHPEAGPYAWAVLSDTLCYAASIVAVIADGIADVDQAMRKGYSWKHGPFEIIDILGVNWFIGKLEEEGRAVPQILEAARGKHFYITERGSRLALGTDGKYTTVPTPEGYFTLEDVKRRAPAPLASNNDASLWDMGDGIVCLELTTRDNVITPGVLQIIGATLKLGHDKRFKGLVIGNDSDTFSAGADLRLLLEAAQPAQQKWAQIDDAIKDGQHAMQGLKYAPFPVVSALAGKALGGGCELLLHSDAIQAHANSFPGLVEPAVGLVPAWGGCTQMLMRQSFPVVKHVPEVFQNIARCRVANSIDEARAMKILRPGDRITMNRSRLLADAKSRCLELALDYTPPRRPTVHLTGAALEASHRRQGRCTGAERQNHRARRGRLQNTLHRDLRRVHQSHPRARRAAVARSRAHRVHGTGQDRSDIEAHRPHGDARQAVPRVELGGKGTHATSPAFPPLQGGKESPSPDFIPFPTFCAGARPPP